MPVASETKRIFRQIWRPIRNIFFHISAIDFDAISWQTFSKLTNSFSGEVIQHKEALDQKHEDQKYDENEVNGNIETYLYSRLLAKKFQLFVIFFFHLFPKITLGKFRITSEEWTDSLTDRNSIDYRELTTTLSTGKKYALKNRTGS